jgi:hypothetical protein
VKNDPDFGPASIYSFVYNIWPVEGKTLAQRDFGSLISLQACFADIEESKE